MAETTAQELPPEPEAPTRPPSLTAEEMDAIAQGNLALQQALDQDSNLMTELETVIREHTRRGITPTTLQAIGQGLEFYLEAQSIQYLLTLLIRSDDATYIEQVKAQTAPQTWNWLRRLLALYGGDMREVNRISGVNEDSWRVINRRAFYDAVTGRWGVTLEIVKYNGQSLFLDETPDSALLLANGILDTLTSVPAEVAPDVFATDTVNRLAVLSIQLINLHAPAEPEEQRKMPEE